MVVIYGADVNHAFSGHPPPPPNKLPTYHGRTAIIAAAEYGHAEVCVKLVKLGAEVSVVDMYAWMPFLKAILLGILHGFSHLISMCARAALVLTRLQALNAVTCEPGRVISVAGVTHIQVQVLQYKA